MSGKAIYWRKPTNKSAMRFKDGSKPDLAFARPRAQTFREDPLPDRPVKARERGVTLPKFKCLETV